MKYIPIWLGGKIQLKINVIKKFGIKMLDPYSSVPFMPDPDWPDWSLTAPVIQRHVNRYGPLRTNFFQYERYFKKYYDINIKNENQ
jgi:hypothetical protein